MHGACYEHALAPRHALRHQHGFSRGRRSVIHRGVRHFLSRELAHQRLKLEDRLQRALRDFRLIGRIRGEKLSSLNNRVRNNRAQMIVNARAKKTRIPDRILRGSLFKILNDLGFRVWPGNLQRFAQPEALGNAGKQFVDGFCANGAEHFLPLGGALREGAHQAEAS